MHYFRIFSAFVSLLFIFGQSHAAPEPITLSNDHIEVTIDPQKGLILGFNRPGEENLLWVNPKPISNPKRNNGWVNYGGDKLWWGPMIDWMSVKGRRLPPDEALDTPWEVIQHNNDTLIIRSVVSQWVGIQATRKISLTPESSEIVIHNSFTRVNASDHRLQLWTITQVRPPLWAVLDSNPKPGEPPFVNRRPQFDPLPYLSMSPATNSVRYRYNEDGPNMIGSRGAWVAAVYEDNVLVHEVSPSRGGDYATDVSVQIFSIKGFLELETLSANATPKVGETMSNTVRWMLLPRPTDLAADELTVWIGEQMSR